MKAIAIAMQVAVAQGIPVAFAVPTQVVPYPVQLVPNQPNCLILNPSLAENWTEQEKYVSTIWTETERWVWQQLCVGKEADLANFNADDRHLSSNFLKTIFLREPFRSALPEKVTIANAVFAEDVDLSSAIIDREVHFQNCQFDRDVKLFKARLAHSIYFSGSQFQKRLALNNAIVGGSVILDDTTFNVNFLDFLKEDDHQPIVNLSSIQVEDSVRLSGVRFQQSREILTQVRPLTLSSARIGNSVDLRDARFAVDGDRNNWEAVDLSSMQVEDSIIADNRTRFSELNLKSTRGKSWILEVDEFRFNSLRNFDATRYFKSSSSWLFGRGEPQPEIRALNLLAIELGKINFEDAAIKNFQVILVGDREPLRSVYFQNLPPAKVELRERSPQQHCVLQLDGFQYQKANDAGFKFLIFYLEDVFNRIKNNNCNSERSQLNQYNALLQPFQQAAIVAREMGNYPLEKELLYRRKKLEFYIAKEHGLFWPSLSLRLSDFVYGFGYYRIRGLGFFGIIWLLGTLLASKQIRKQQSDLIRKVIRVRRNEIADEQIKTQDDTPGKRHCGNVSFDDIRPYIDAIDKIIFDGLILENSTRKPRVYIKFAEQFCLKEKFHCAMGALSRIAPKENLGEPYLEINFKTDAISQAEEKISYLARAAGARNPNHTKVGFCENFFPDSGLWLVYAGNGQQYARSLDRDLLYRISEGERGWFANQIDREAFKKASLYSFDILLPIIELDPHLHHFIFDGSSGFARLYFLFQKLMAAVLASILIPILFVTGL